MPKQEIAEGKSPSGWKLVSCRLLFVLSKSADFVPHAANISKVKIEEGGSSSNYKTLDSQHWNPVTSYNIRKNIFRLDRGKQYFPGFY